MPEQRKYNLKIQIHGTDQLKVPCYCGCQNWALAILPVYMECNNEDVDHDHMTDEPIYGMRFLQCVMCGRSRVWLKSNTVAA